MTDESIFTAALALKTDSERQAFLDEVCNDNPALRAEVEALLKADAGAGSFLNHPPVGTDATIAMTAEHDTVDAGSGTVSLAFLRPCETPGRIGQIDHYEVIEVVGQGGMGVVMRAFDTKLSRIVAVKVMAPELAANPQAVKRFLREAKATAAVHHDHVVTIHAVEDQHRPPYIVMQFIEGQTLQQKIDADGALELREILRIGSQMAAGLAAAHKHGLIHRDVKPANILLENGVERVKITDFGLARAADDMEMTQTGLIAGTPQYMSPEQAKGEIVDARSDLFSLGSVLYTMCTGRPGFRAETTMGVLKRVCEDSPRPIRDVHAEIPPWLEAIVGKLLAKNPVDRFQSASEVAELLNQHLAHVQNPAQVPRPATVVLPLEQPFKHTLHPNYPPAAPAPASGAGAAIVVALLLSLLVIIPIVLIGVGLIVPYLQARNAARKHTVPTGVLSLHLNDPRIEFRIDGHGANQTAVSVLQVPLEAGEHHVWCKLDDMELKTATFRIERGTEARLELDITPTRARAAFNGQPLDVTLLAGGTMLPGDWPDVPEIYRLAEKPADWPNSSEGFIQLAANATSFEPLFNGRDLTGWEAPPGEPPAWQVVDGVLVGRGAYSYLVSLRRDYRDFHLRAKVRINRGGNSGLYFRAELPADWKSRGCIGYEAEITSADDGGKTGSLRRYPQSSILKQVDETLVPAGQWFIYDVIAVGNRIQTLVNGKPAASATDDTHAQGRVALQLIREGQTVVEFSRIEIRELVPTSLFAATGWTPLFSGQDLAGWTAHPDEPGAWTVKDSTIVGRGRNHYLYSARGDFQDFWLRAEVKLGAGADSGLLVRMAPPSEGPAAESGYEVQLAGDPAHTSPTASIIRHGSLVGGQVVKGRGDLIQADKWFVLDIAAIGGTLTVAIDGRQVASYRDRRPPIRGHIALQSFSEGAEVSFRKIEISELSAAMDEASSVVPGSSADILTSSDYEWTAPENLGPVINSADNDGEPTISGDGLTLVFYSNRAGGHGHEDLWLSKRPSPEVAWESPVNLGSAVNGPDTDGGPALSADARTLIFHSNRPGGQGESDLWMSTRADADQPWSSAVNLGANINSASEEIAPSLSADRLMLIFNSDRPGRYGKGDLWFATRSSLDSPWSSAQNFGPQVNSPAFQGIAALASDGLSLIFNSNGGGGPWSGPLRISTRPSAGADWSPPRGFWSDALGAWSACLAADHQTLLFDSKRTGGQGGFDIWSSRRVRVQSIGHSTPKAPSAAIAPFDAAQAREDQ